MAEQALIYYNLECIRELPDVEQGYKCMHISQQELTRGPGWDRYDFRNRELNIPYEESKQLEKKLRMLFAYKDNERFVKKTLDLSRANQDLSCPYCKEKSLYHYESDLEKNYDAGVTKLYIHAGFQCGICKKIFLTGKKICVETSVSW